MADDRTNVELRKKLRHIEIATSRLATDQMAGQYRSVFKGRGMSFEEVRPYQDGDDIRLLPADSSCPVTQRACVWLSGRSALLQSFL